MSLAPTLYLERIVPVAVGTAVAVGLLTNIFTNVVIPAPASVSVTTDLVPFVSVIGGPTAQPSGAALGVVSQIPFLQRILRITAGLPDGATTDNNLIPTLVWADSTAPTSGLVSMGGRVPAVILSGSQTISTGVGATTMAGLVPVVVVPVGQDQLALPARGQVDLLGLAPVMIGGLVRVMPAPGSASDFDGQKLTNFKVVGLVPNLGIRSGWHTVALAGVPVWTDVPTAV